MIINETIVACATPPLLSALAIVRLSGPASHEILQKLTVFKFEKIEERKVYNLKLYFDKNDKSTLIDDSVVIMYLSPRSFTGEDMVEFIVHGSPVIVDELLQACIKYGARLAVGGEFSAKAYYNNKIPLLQAEAINDLIHSPSKLSKQLSLDNLLGKNAAILNDIEEEIKLILANIEVNIDYPEYDYEELSNEVLTKRISSILDKLHSIISESESSRLLVSGVNIVIAGVPNVGKSTLLNALIGEEKAIVTSLPGTTRDIVEGTLLYQGIKLNFFDTAGIRESDDVIETLGIKKSREEILKADLVLYVYEASNGLTREDEAIIKGITAPYIIVSNKIDLLTENNDSLPGIKIDAKSGNPQVVLQALQEKLKINVVSPKGFTSTRDIGLLKEIEERLLSAMSNSQNGLSVDLLVIDIYGAINKINELKGEDNVVDLSTTIFNHFCVGK